MSLISLDGLTRRKLCDVSSIADALEIIAETQ